MTRSLVRGAWPASVASVASVALVASGACLPLPAEKAKIDVAMRAGPAEVLTDDGYVVHFDRRLIVLGATISSTTGGGGNFAPQLRDLDAPPLPLPPLRALGERFVGVSTQSHSEKTPSGPTVTADEIEAMGSFEKHVAPSSMWLRGTISRNGERWHFDWRASLYIGRVCGVSKDGRLTTIGFDAETQHGLEIDVHVERLFVDAKRPGLRAEAFVDADIDRDHDLTTTELFRGANLVDDRAKIFDVALDGAPLECAAPNDAYGLLQRD